MSDTHRVTPPAPLKALGALAMVVVVSAGFIGIAAALGLHEVWPGFLLVVCFGFFEEMKPAALPGVLVGALLGTGVAALPVTLVPVLGLVGAYAIMLAIILGAIYLLLLGRTRMLVSPTMLTFLTVVTIPHILPAARVGDIVAAEIVAAAYYGGLALFGSWRTAWAAGVSVVAVETPS